ncbi:hypothetical protein ACFE04_026918 [Oxalis oulophora]
MTAPPPPISLRPILKRPKLEHEEEEEDNNNNNNNNRNGAVSNDLEEEAKEKGDEESKKNNVNDLEEQEEALLALIEHRTKEVQHLNKRIAHYQSQREAAEIRLQDSQSALARLWARRENGLSVSNVSQSQLNETKSICDRENGSLAFKASLPNETKSTSDRENGSSAFKVSQPNEIKSTSDRENGSSAFKVSQRTETKSMNEEPKLTSPLMKSSKTQPQRKTELVIPSVIPETSFAKKPSVPTVKAASTASSVRASPSTSTSGMVKVKIENPSRTTPDPKVVERQEKGLKRKLEEKQHKELIPLICSNSKAGSIRFNTSNYFPSQHKRKLRSLTLCPVNDQLFVTSALDGMMNLWQLHSRGTHEKQLHLYDIRLRQTELHVFGWKQESSDSQSALINQSWSPDGLKITSGSADPKIHIFDIRYNGREPCHSLRVHQKRVFKAEWHFFHPLLISISSDLNIGLHKIV